MRDKIAGALFGMALGDAWACLRSCGEKESESLFRTD